MAGRKFWVMDYETIVNCFVAVFRCYTTGERRIFAIHELQDDSKAFVEFLEECRDRGDWHFGYNNLAFDAQITETVLHFRQNILYGGLPATEIASTIYQYAQETIGKSRRGEFLDYPEFKLTIPCVDIYKLNHWDSNAKRASLKWVQFSMDWRNVEEMPHPYYEPVNDKETLQEVIDYCINDVDSTFEVFNYKDSSGKKIMIPQINLRSELSQTYNVKLYSASEPRISKEIFLHFLSEKLKLPKKVIRDMRTFRTEVVMRDVILPEVKFETPEFQVIHTWFKGLIVDTMILDKSEEELKKKGPKLEIIHKGVPTTFALGGIHGCIRSGVYTPKKGQKILSVDVKSYYPNLAIRNQWSPKHIPQTEFCELYEWMYEERKLYPKSSPLNYLFKIILNSKLCLQYSKYVMFVRCASFRKLSAKYSV